VARMSKNSAGRGTAIEIEQSMQKGVLGELGAQADPKNLGKEESGGSSHCTYVSRERSGKGSGGNGGSEMKLFLAASGG